ncbi:MAG: hypothetical protein AB2598_19980 [Candidatus Thiodiazotropha sp.]
MRYSDWQIDRIRSRLVAYRYKKGNNGRPRPWKGVLYDILLCPDTAHVFPEDGSHPEFKEEALRRFAAGTSILSPDKIHDLRVFLVKEHFLKEKELEDAPYDIEEALTLHGYLASNSDEARAYLSKLPTHFEAERVGDGMKETFHLQFKRDPSGDYLLVQTIYEREVEQTFEHARLERKDDYKSCRQQRRGFGFVCTNQNLLYLFTHGPVKQDNLNYMQIALNEPSVKEETIRLMVSGLKVPIHHVPLEYKEGSKDKLVNFNTLDFAQSSHEAMLEELMNELR